MTVCKKVVRFMINRHDGAADYDLHIDKTFDEKSENILYKVEEAIDYNKKLPRKLALFIFWFRAQYKLFFGKIDVAIVSPAMLLIYPKRVSVIVIFHHYDPSVFKGIRLIYVKFSQWLFILQKSRVNMLVTPAKYWKQYFLDKGFKNIRIIRHGFDIDTMDQSIRNNDKNFVLNKFNLTSKKYLHLGSYGPAKGQKIVIKNLSNIKIPMIATGSKKIQLLDDLKEITFINATYAEYNILLKNALAVICMSEFKEGWCRVLHEAAIHGTSILGSGLGGMSEVLQIGGFTSSSPSSLSTDLNNRVKHSLSENQINSYRAFSLERFRNEWHQVIVQQLILND